MNNLHKEKGSKILSEGYFHSNIHLVLKLLGVNVISEDATNIGRIDAAIELIDKI
ncbi:MAG: PD-(D/E)XK nuclease domain-containing protein [Prevotella sp.]|nr:PD-(D/E)XK nuclease domain-containing protein [Prevotella sp.]